MPHTATILQSLDILTFSKIKQSWKKLLSNHFKQANAQSLDKPTFALLVSFILFFFIIIFIYFWRYPSCSKIIYYQHIAVVVSQKLGSIRLTKRVISKEKLNLLPAIVEQDASISQLNTTDNIDDNTFKPLIVLVFVDIHHVTIFLQIVLNDYL